MEKRGFLRCTVNPTVGSTCSKDNRTAPQGTEKVKTAPHSTILPLKETPHRIEFENEKAASNRKKRWKRPVSFTPVAGTVDEAV